MSEIYLTVFVIIQGTVIPITSDEVMPSMAECISVGDAEMAEYEDGNGKVGYFCNRVYIKHEDVKI